MFNRLCILPGNPPFVKQRWHSRIQIQPPNFDPGYNQCMEIPPEDRPARLREVLAVFLKLGVIGFGGPAAHISMMHDEVVRRRKWVTDQHFLDMLGATNLIPGPNSTEMAIHLGFVRAGWPGLLAGGLCFILPAMFMVLGLSWAYVRYGSLPAAGWLLYGIKPVVIALIVQALWSLGTKALRGLLPALVGLVVFALYFLGLNELALLFAGGLLVMVVQNAIRLRKEGKVLSLLPLALPADAGKALLPGIAFGGLAAAKVFSLPLMFLAFLKIGAVLYGGGYVLLAFLRGDFVTRFGWLTERQLLDAVAIGQVTPGPLFTTATFIGYLLGGVPGGMLATLGIFLPSFLFVALSTPLIPHVRASPWACALLDGVNASALGLMAAVTLQLGQDALIDPLTVGLALAAAVVLFRFRINATWLILAGGLVGLLRYVLGAG
jgi:chromate transporter